MHEFWLAQYQPHKFLTSLRFCIESCVGQLRKPPPRIFVPVHYFCFCPWLKFLDVCLIVPCTLDDAEFVTAFILLTAIAYSQLHVSTNPLCRCSRINLTVITLTDSFLVPRLLATCRRTCVPIASRCCGRNAWRIVLVFFFFCMSIVLLHSIELICKMIELILESSCLSRFCIYHYSSSDWLWLDMPPWVQKWDTVITCSHFDELAY